MREANEHYESAIDRTGDTRGLVRFADAYLGAGDALEKDAQGLGTGDKRQGLNYTPAPAECPVSDAFPSALKWFRRPDECAHQ